MRSKIGQEKMERSQQKSFPSQFQRAVSIPVASKCLFFRNRPFHNTLKSRDCLPQDYNNNQLRFSSSHVLARYLTAGTVRVQRHRYCSVSGNQHIAQPLMHPSSAHHQMGPQCEQPPRHNHAARLSLSVILVPALRTGHLHNRLANG